MDFWPYIDTKFLTEIKFYKAYYLLYSEDFVLCYYVTQLEKL